MNAQQYLLLHGLLVVSSDMLGSAYEDFPAIIVVLCHLFFVYNWSLLS